jgi:endonuclease/exonuclease/phosphatase family metal-dependent hydrolase
LTGDFNAEAGVNKAYAILTEDGFLPDTWKTARERRNEKQNSFHNFAPLRQDGIRIDWILGRNLGQCSWTEIVPDGKNAQSPSDHCPVVAHFE